MIKVVRTLEEVEAIHEAWQELLLEAQHVTPFQSPAYALSAWEMAQPQKRELHVICYYQEKNNSLQAILPCYIDDHRTLRFINDIHTDFCDAIVRNGMESNYHLWKDVAEHIKNESKIKRVNLINLTVESYLTSYFRFFLRPSTIYCINAFSKIIIERCQTGQNFVTTLPHLNQQEKKKLRNAGKKIEGLEWKIYQLPEDYPSFLMDEITSSMISTQIRKDSYFSQIMPIVRSLYQSGLVELFVSLKENKPVAVKVFLKMPGTNEYISWLMLYTEKQFNQLNILQSIKHISETGGDYNFARGTYGYKMEKLRPTIYNLYSFRWSKTTIGQLGDIWQMGKYQLRQIAKKIIRG